jgi:hypothetical protein
MAGSNICQRETMNVNHGLYYVDLTASATTQTNFASSYPPPNTGNRSPKKNIFVGGKKYDFFLVYAKPTTVQTYQMFVGAGLDPATVTKGVQPIRANVVNAPFVISADTVKSGLTPPPAYNSSTGILTVTLNLSAYATDFTTAATALCVPRLFCQPTASGCGGKAGGLGNLTQAERNIVCGRAGEDVDCPTGGCVGFSVTLPAGFVASDQTTANNSALVKGLAMCFPMDVNWNVTPVAAAPSLAGTCVGANAPLIPNFCSTALPRTGR